MAIVEKRKIPLDDVLERLGTFMRQLEMMTAEERTAALKFAQLRFGEDWPRSDY